MNKIQADIPQGMDASQKVVEAVAEAKGVPPDDLTPTLYEAIDPEALDHIFAGPRAVGKVAFNYHNCEISVFSDGFVAVKTHSR